ncbi:MAG: alcohol dehydrogenase catalytic domain-containing protein [Firmicutes bacterium]|jgi:L-iditol 2-dehydrogenase|nr:alcohol dehydrogenase catalytic domain-containing protein [Bacillota bacterium]
MKVAVYYGPGKMEIEDWPVPPVEDRDILIRIRTSMVCGTDVKTFLRGHPLFKPPTVLGHEFAGEVVEVGAAVRSVAPGDRVTVAPFISDDVCFYCRAGLKELCPSRRYLSNGAFSEYVKIDEDYARTGLVKLSSDVTWQEGALTEPIACVVNAVSDLHITPGDTVAVVGAGPMGLLNALISRASGAGSVAVLEIDAGRRAIAGSMGFITVDPGSEDAVARIKSLTDGRGSDQVILAVGSASLIPDAMALARPGAKVMLFGGFPQGESARFNPNLVHYQQVSVIGTSGFTPEDFAHAGKLVNSRAFDLRPLITHRFRIDEIRKAIETAASTESLKVEIALDE